jgi:hypothetical protein
MRYLNRLALIEESNMRRLLQFCMACAVLVFQADLALASDDIVVLGSGGRDCATFAKGYKKEPDFEETLLRTWITGYLSGRNEMSRQSGGDWKNLKVFDLDSAVSRIKVFCDQHPLLHFHLQLAPMYDALPSVVPR